MSEEKLKPCPWCGKPGCMRQPRYWLPLVGIATLAVIILILSGSMVALVLGPRW